MLAVGKLTIKADVVPTPRTPFGGAGVFRVQPFAARRILLRLIRSPLTAIATRLPSMQRVADILSMRVVPSADGLSNRPSLPRGKRGQSPFVRSTLRAVPANGDCPLFPRAAY